MPSSEGMVLGRGAPLPPTHAPLSEPPASRRAIWSWMMFDWAAQPFSTLILTFIFAPYLTSRALSNQSAQDFLSMFGLGFMVDPAVAANDAGAQTVWGLAAAVIGISTALASPVLGAMADATGPRKPWLLAFSVLAIVGSCGLWVLVPGADTGTIALALMFYAIAFFGFEFATVFNNAMMPDLVPRAELGRLSGNAWALGYVGGLVTLVIVLALMSASPETGRTLLGLEPILDLDPLTGDGDRAAGPFTALWYAVFVLPLFLFVPDVSARERATGAIKKGLRELRATIRSLPEQRSLFAYLGSSMLYRDALNGLYTFGGIYAAGVLGWSVILIGVFGIIAALVGALGAYAGGWLDKRFGPKAVVTGSIVMLIAVTFTVVATTPQMVLFLPVGEVVPAITMNLPLVGSLDTPDLVFFFCGAVIGGAGGALQAASRTLLVDQADPTRMTEAFGLYALSGKATSFIAPALVAVFTALFDSQRAGMIPLVALFIAGLFLLPLVRQRIPA